MLDALDEALGERVVADVPGSRGRLRFAHALIRDTLYDGLTTTRRARLHERAGEALEAVYAADPEPHLAELAQHFAAAAPAAARSARSPTRAARATARGGPARHEEAVRHDEIALDARDRPPRCAATCCSSSVTPRPRRGNGRGEGGVPRRRRPRRPPGPARAARPRRARLRRKAELEVSRDDERLVPLLERAIAAAGTEDSILRVRLLARLAGGPLRDARFPPSAAPP